MARTKVAARQYYNRDHRQLPGWDQARTSLDKKPPNKGRPRIPGRRQNCSVKIKRMRKFSHFRRVDVKQNVAFFERCRSEEGHFILLENFVWNIDLHFLIRSKEY